MFKKTKGFVMGFVCCLVIVAAAGSAFASTGTVNATLTFRDIKLMIDGALFTPKDAAGNIVEPFIYNGATYLPVRVLGEAIGKTIRWDGDSNTVFISDGAGGTVPSPTGGALTKAAPPYDKHYTASVQENAMMGGSIYYDVIRFQGVNSIAIGYTFHNLGGTYKKITGFIGKVDGAYNTSATIRFFGDGILLESWTISGEDMPKPIIVDVTGVTQLKIEAIGNALSSSTYALSATIE